MTVSNVVNGNYAKVSKQTIDRINALIEEMDYIPNVNARILSTSRSNLITMCINNSGKDNILEDPYNSFIIGAVSRKAQEKGYAVLLENENDLKVISSHLKSWNTAGAIFLGFNGSSLKALRQSLDIPFVCLDCYPNTEDILSIGTHDYSAGKLAGNYLVSLGHKNIAFASGPTVLSENSETLNPLLHYRFEGFKKALADEGITFSVDNILTGEISYEDGIKIGMKLSTSEDVTAVFCTADILAAGVIEGLRLCGKRVPQEMSVLGFDNLPVSKHIYPKLSTINQQNNLKGESAVEYIIKMIESPYEKLESIYYDVTLVERQSTFSV